MSKPKFNPNQPYEILEKPKFDPNQPFEEINDEPSVFETVAGKLANGGSFGFVDELAGGIESVGQAAGVSGLGGKLRDIKISDDGPTLDFEKLKSAYVRGRDNERLNQDEMSNAHPVISGISEIAGGLATAPISSGATALARAGQAARLGAVAGFGSSQADLTKGDYFGAATDTAIGSALGGALQYGGEKAINSLSKINKDSFNKGVSKLASLTTGADEDALLRNITRPNQIKEAMSDDFSHLLGKRVVGEVDDLSGKLGRNVNEAKNQFLKSQGIAEFDDLGNSLANQVDDFLNINAPSQKGFSALSKKEITDLNQIRDALKGGQMNGEDLVKLREYLDHTEKLASKYGAESGPYSNFLKGLRGNADSILDNASPEINAANSAFAQFKDDSNLLRSASNEGQAEKMINNLFGANKGAQQDAASRLFSSETLERAKDIAANKAIKGANNPGGQNYFRHGALPVMTLGASELATRPELVAKALRGLGTVENKISYLLKNNPNYLGKYAAPLADAMKRGNQAVAATHFILQQQNPEYRKLLQGEDK